ncbi:MAG: arylmalonate decarboxylase [Proteobacteria bacterium]|nr:arylmalonate decarboxylase [Pseudomonadota bacterium]
MNKGSGSISSKKVDIQFDQGRDWRARIGFILVPTDGVIEGEMFKLAPPGVGVHFTRLPGSDDVTVENLLAMEHELEGAASRFVFGEDLSVICFACTSASALIGEQRVNEALSRGVHHAKPTSLISGVLQALRAFKATKIVIASPYLDDVNTLEANYLEDQGFEILEFQGMNILHDSDIRRVDPKFIKDYAKKTDCDEAEAIFISCGGLRSIEIIDALEQEVGKPVVTSNQAMFWNTLRMAGIKDKIEGYGRLFIEH